MDQYEDEMNKVDNQQEDTELADEVASYGILDGFSSNSAQERQVIKENHEESTVEDLPKNQAFGWIALIIAIGSFFVWPAVLGPVAVILGIIAFISGHRALGIWSVVVGLISFTGFLFLVPLYS